MTQFWFNTREFGNPFSNGKKIAVLALILSYFLGNLSSIFMYIIFYGLILDLIQIRKIPGVKFIKDRLCPVCGDGTINEEISVEKFHYKHCNIDVKNYVTLICNICKVGIPSLETFEKTEKILDEFYNDVDYKEKEDQCDNKEN